MVCHAGSAGSARDAGYPNRQSGREDKSMEPCRGASENHDDQLPSRGCDTGSLCGLHLRLVMLWWSTHKWGST
jgi:hypothetical protein